MTLLVAVDIALYSASDKLLDTMPCFFDFQLTIEFPNNSTYPYIDLLMSTQAPHSESEYAWSVNDLMP